MSKPLELPLLADSEIVQYISSELFRGIGKKTALLLVRHWGQETLSILDNEPERLYQIPSLTAYRIAAITKAWSTYKENPLRRVLALLLGNGLSLGLSLKICNYYSHSTEAVLSQDPYRLVDEVEGIGFKTADQLALTLGHSPDSKQRYEQAVIHVLKDALNEGHCFLPSSLLLKRTLALLKRPDYLPVADKVEAALTRAINQCDLSRGELSDSIYLSKVYHGELRAAAQIKTLLEQPTCETEQLEHWLASQQPIDEPESDHLSGEQCNALLMAVRHPISILTGGPGRGKTHVLKKLVEWLTIQKKNLALAAPTGKAANRMQAATGYEAQTIHRLLHWQGVGHHFLYNQDNPLPIDWLIVDEFSMVDIFLFNSLLKALPAGVKILLVGDPDQLPSVGPGMVLRDLLISETIPNTRLTKIFRQRNESPIIYAAEDVNQGRVPFLPRFTQAQEWMNLPDCAMLETSTPDSTAKAIVELVRSMKATNVDLNEHLIVLAPQKKGSAGVHNLNQLLQPIFNPPTPNQLQVVSGEVVYRVGDRVIQLKNRYDTIPAVMNGESGKVVSIDAKKSMVTVAFSEGAIVDYYPGNFEQIMHSYCLTCHKFQGSEMLYVIMPLLMSNRQMLTRQLLYTTITRAAYVFITVGQNSALEYAVATDKPAKRYTQLPIQLLTQVEKLNTYLNSLRANAVKNKTAIAKVTIASRLKERSLEATQGQMTTIGSLALQLYEDKYGHRPSKQPEQVGKYKFKTYHYESSAVKLIDQAIDLFMSNER